MDHCRNLAYFLIIVKSLLRYIIRAYNSFYILTKKEASLIIVINVVN
jgi:hypothetical protein